MPTLVVETNVNQPIFQRRFAKDISMWLHKQGVQINHVITKFQNFEASQVFSGPYSFDRFPCLAGGQVGNKFPTPVNFAFITCYISQDRPAEFRTEMATVIAQVMQPEVKPEYIFINFQLVDPNNYINGKNLQITVKEEVLQS